MGATDEVLTDSQATTTKTSIFIFLFWIAKTELWQRRGQISPSVDIVATPLSLPTHMQLQLTTSSQMAPTQWPIGLNQAHELLTIFVFGLASAPQALDLSSAEHRRSCCISHQTCHTCFVYIVIGCVYGCTACSGGIIVININFNTISLFCGSICTFLLGENSVGQ